MKIAILGDTHFGVRNDSELFLNMQERYYSNFFFPYLKEHGIATLIQTGDIFDKRKNINIRTLNRAKQFFFDRVLEQQIDFTVVMGNHDTYYKNTNRLNSVQTLIEDNPKYLDFRVVVDFDEVEHDGKSVHLIGWVNEENTEMIKEKIESSAKDICIGHFELAGFEMMKGVESKHGTMKAKDLSDYKTVFSGHYHRPSQKGNIVYVGTPYELTWTDYADEKSFVVYDTKTDTFERVRTPDEYSLYVRATADEIMQGIDLQGKIVKVIVNDQTDFKKLNNLMESSKCHDYQYVMSDQQSVSVDMGELGDVGVDNPVDVLIEYIKTVEEADRDQKIFARLAHKVYNEAIERIGETQ